MTGFSRKEVEIHPFGRIIVEISSLNHRFIEVDTKIPKFLSFLTFSINQLVRNRFSRGRFHVFLKFMESEKIPTKLIFREDLLKEYLSILENIEKRHRLFGSLSISDIPNLPGVFSLEGEEPGEELSQQILSIIDDTLSDLRKSRLQEGERLAKDISLRIGKLKELVKEIKGLSNEHKKHIKDKLLEALKEMEGDVQVDEDRLAQEVLFYTERSDITEEIVRIESHIKNFQETLPKNEPVGRKLDFLCQELLREINTIGSKSSLPEISALVVEFKEELEKIRQQVQNLE